MEENFLYSCRLLVLTKSFLISLHVRSCAYSMGPYLQGSLPADHFRRSFKCELIGVGLSIEGGAYLRNFMVLSKLFKAARGKRNKVYENAASFSKMLNSNKSLSQIFNTKVTNNFKIIQVQQKRSHMKCFYSVVSEECCFHGKDRDTAVWCCSG